VCDAHVFIEIPGCIQSRVEGPNDVVYSRLISVVNAYKTIQFSAECLAIAPEASTRHSSFIFTLSKGSQTKQTHSSIDVIERHRI